MSSPGNRIPNFKKKQWYKKNKLFYYVNIFSICKKKKNRDGIKIMNEEDKKNFLEDFKKADIEKKMDMWFYALEQIALWEETIAEMSDIAQKTQQGKKAVME